MCNNNGHCRKFDAGTMCPSYRVTGDEQHTTRGRANTLRLALSGQLGSERGATQASVKDALDLCVSCKGCRRECPTGCRHGAHEGRVPQRVPDTPRAYAARAVDRLPSPLRAGAGAARAACEPRKCAPAARLFRGFYRAALPAAVAQRLLARRRARCTGRYTRGAAFCRHVQPLFRAGERACGDPRSAGCGLPGQCACRSRRRTAAVLRAHVPFGRARGRSQARSAAADRRSAPVRRARRARDRARAFVHVRRCATNWSRCCRVPRPPGSR
jgi:NAD-dependent dihydropyrimidine dehydrogenase PreA subunit